MTKNESWKRDFAIHLGFAAFIWLGIAASQTSVGDLAIHALTHIGFAHSVARNIVPPIFALGGTIVYGYIFHLFVRVKRR